MLEIPTIRIVPRALADEPRAKLREFGKHFDWLVFTSPNGVELFLSELVAARLDIRTLGAVKIAALGPGHRE